MNNLPLDLNVDKDSLGMQALDTPELIHRVILRNELTDSEEERLHSAPNMFALVHTLREMGIFIDQGMEGMDSGWVISPQTAVWFQTYLATERTVYWFEVDLETQAMCLVNDFGDRREI